jgi:hypothetical protein
MRVCDHCGTDHHVTQHHVGGRNFIAWLTMSLCAKCQELFHAKQRAAAIDLRFTPNSKLRLIRALKMAILFVWMLLDKLEGEIKSDIRQIRELPEISCSEDKK